MRTRNTKLLVRLVILLMFAVLAMGFQISANAQTPAPAVTPAPAPSPLKRTHPVVNTARRVVVVNKPSPPQVVTILHTLNGLKVFRLLVRSKEQIEAIARLDEAFKIAGGVHTNVIAGLALDEHTIAAWLPEAEAEMPPRAVSLAPPPAPRAVPGQRGAVHVPAPEVSVPPPPATAVGVGSINLNGNLLEADLRVITRDGKRIPGKYIGIDGLTGLSLITLTDEIVAQTTASAETVAVGDKLRVIGPQPASNSENGSRTYIRIAETEAVVADVTRSPSGGLARLKIRSSKLSPINIGGIAINENGETLGIVNSVKGEGATVVPLALVRNAAKRVMARQASVPRPWLGIHGEPVITIPLEKILRGGWEIERARALADRRQGIMLTSVAPGSPAALAKLKPGDVILSVNDDFIRNAEEFSWSLDEIDPDSTVRFTVARPGKPAFENFDIKLSESPDPFFGLRRWQEYFPKPYKAGPLFGQGVETVALKPKVAMRLGSSGGLLVVSVQPSTDAFKSGLRAGDVIESVDGQPIYSGNAMVMLPKRPSANSTYVVVRNKEKMTFTFKFSDNKRPDNNPNAPE